MNRLAFYQKVLSELETIQTNLNTLRNTIKEEIQGEKQAHV